MLRIPQPDAALDVRVRARNFGPEIGRKLEPGCMNVVVIDVGAAVNGRLLRDGKPAAGVLLGFAQVSRISANYLGEDEIATDKKGRFAITGLGPNETYEIYEKVDDRTRKRLAIVRTRGDATSVDAGTIEAPR